jgi:hypothetical protein
MSPARFATDTPTVPLWQVLYQDAIFEFDDAELPKRISKARDAIHDRTEEILKCHPSLLMMPFSCSAKVFVASWS